MKMECYCGMQMSLSSLKLQYRLKQINETDKVSLSLRNIHSNMYNILKLFGND